MKSELIHFSYRQPAGTRLHFRLISDWLGETSHIPTLKATKTHWILGSDGIIQVDSAKPRLSMQLGSFWIKSLGAGVLSLFPEFLRRDD
jgi:hypothetical protein